MHFRTRSVPLLEGCTSCGTRYLWSVSVEDILLRGYLHLGVKQQQSLLSGKCIGFTAARSGPLFSTGAEGECCHDGPCSAQENRGPYGVPDQRGVRDPGALGRVWCVWRGGTLKPRGQDVGFFLGTGAPTRHSFVNSYTQVFLLKSTCCVPATVLAVGETVVKEALPRGVHVPGETDTWKESYYASFSMLEFVAGEMDSQKEPPQSPETGKKVP